MRAALTLQAATFARALTPRIATALVVIAPAAFSIGFVALARSSLADSPNAAQFAPYAEGPFASAAADLAGQMTTVWALLAAGFAVAWIVGREWADGTYGSLFALPVSRARIGWAKVVVVLAWGAAAVTAATMLVASGIAVLDAAHLTADVWTQLGRVWIAGLLMVGLALPFGAVAVLGRGYLGAVAAIIAATAVSQILASLGLGAWTPYVAPALWAGAGGEDMAAGIGAVHLALALVFSGAGAWLLVWLFGSRRLD